MYLLLRLKLFLGLVFREIEPRSCGIPDPYRMPGVMSPKLAWDVAKIIYPSAAEYKRQETLLKMAWAEAAAMDKEADR